MNLPLPTTYLARLIGRHSTALRRAAGLATLTEALWIPQAWLIADALAAMVQNSSAAETLLLRNLLAFLFLGLLRAALTAIAGHILARRGDSLTGDIREAILRQADRNDGARGSAASAAVAALATDKLALLLPYLRRWPVARMRVAVVPLLIVLLAFPISWVVGLIFLLTGPLIPLFMALVGMAAGQASRDRMDEIADMNTLLVERLTALTDIRLLDARRTMLSGFAKSAERLRSRTMRVLALAFLSSAVLELFSAIGVAMTAVFVGFSLLGTVNFGSWGGLGLGQGVFLLMLAPAFYQPMRDLAAAWHDRADALALARDLQREEIRKAGTILGDGAPAAAKHFTLLQVRDLVFDAKALPDFDLRRGEAVALTGESGAGKTRLIHMLAGLTDPSPGRVLIDAQPLDAGLADQWRAGLALVPQRVHFTDDTLLANLCGGQKITDERVQAALCLAHADQIVARLPDGLTTRLGEQGAGVSGGEARRLMIARAALRQPALLIADEPTADLDDHTAEQVIAGLLQLHRQGATLFVASHDPRMVAAMSREVSI